MNYNLHSVVSSHYLPKMATTANPVIYICLSLRNDRSKCWQDPYRQAQMNHFSMEKLSKKPKVQYANTKYEYCKEKDLLFGCFMVFNNFIANEMKNEKMLQFSAGKYGRMAKKQYFKHLTDPNK